MSACNGCGNAFSCMYPDCAAGAMALESVPDGRGGPTVFADRFRPGEGPYNIRPITLDPARVDEKTARLALSYRMGPPIMPGLNLDDGEPVPRPSRWRLVGRWAGALAMVVGAAAIMYAEGQRQPSPGVGFGIALGLLMGAALLLPLGRSNDG
jgi:hypothetical protein